jgi:hypothetical protein
MNTRTAEHRKGQDPRLPPPTMVFIAKGATGGCGGTTVALLTAAALVLNNIPLAAGRIDAQERLDRVLQGIDVKAADIRLLEASRRGDDAVARALAPVYEHAVAHLQRGAWYLLDQGATRSADTYALARAAALGDDLADLGVRVVSLVPYLASADSVLQAAGTAAEATKTFPGSVVAMVENQRDGRVSDLHPAADASVGHAGALAPATRGLPSIILPRIPPASMAAYERTNLQVAQFLELSTERLMELTGLPRAQARMARGDIAAAFAAFYGGLAQAVGLRPLDD